MPAETESERDSFASGGQRRSLISLAECPSLSLAFQAESERWQFIGQPGLEIQNGAGEDLVGRRGRTQLSRTEGYRRPRC